MANDSLTIFPSYSFTLLQHTYPIQLFSKLGYLCCSGTYYVDLALRGFLCNKYITKKKMILGLLSINWIFKSKVGTWWVWQKAFWKTEKKNNKNPYNFCQHLNLILILQHLLDFHFIITIGDLVPSQGWDRSRPHPIQD